MNDSIELAGGWGRLRPCRHGLFVYNVNDVFIGQSLDCYAEYSEDEVRVITSLLRPGDIAVEVGANIGALVIPMAKAVGPTGAVVAYEPQRIVHQMLCANIALNGLTNVIAKHAAASDAPGTLHVPILDPTKQLNFGDVALERWTEDTGVKVPAETIDSLGLTSCRLIKADVQGMEASVLRGATRTIAAHRPALYIENDQRDKSQALIALIRSMGYRLWWHMPLLFQQNNFAGNPDNIFGRIISLNLLCFPAEANVELVGREVLSDDEWPVDFG
jgi:methyltransferase, FkbM family